MNLTRSKYVDGTYADAKAEGYDVVQLKYDGNWCACIVSSMGIEYYSDTYRLFYMEPNTAPGLLHGTYIGELMRGTQWSQHPERKGKFFVFDVDLPETYRTRYLFIRNLAAQMPAHWSIVTNYRMQARDILWTDSVEQKGFEGLVYHKSTAMPGDKLIREKRLFTLNGIVTGFTAGEGKHEGRMGALLLRMETGVTASIGTGFSDDLRIAVYENPGQYIGRTAEVATNAVFESGNIRHGRFIRWRDDR